MQGDVSELDLTFSVDEDQMGKIVTHELHSGGRARPVTNDNKYAPHSICLSQPVHLRFTSHFQN